MQYFQPPQQRIAGDAARIASGLLHLVGERLTDSQPLSDFDVHEIRKACKRLRALLRLLRPVLTEHEFRETDRKVRKLAGQLGQARDQAVMLDTIERVSQHYAPMLAQDAFAPVRAWLVQDADTPPALARTANASGWFLVPLEDLHSSVHALDLQAAGTDTLLDGLVDSYRYGRRALRQVQQQPDTEPVHALRRHTKYLYNQLTMIADLNRKAIMPLIEQSHRIEETLGEIHDLSVLINAINSAPPLRRDPLRREVLISLLETRWIRQLSGSLRQADTLYEWKPGRFKAWLEDRISIS